LTGQIVINTMRLMSLIDYISFPRKMHQNPNIEDIINDPRGLSYYYSGKATIPENIRPITFNIEGAILVWESDGIELFHFNGKNHFPYFKNSYVYDVSMDISFDDSMENAIQEHRIRGKNISESEKKNEMDLIYQAEEQMVRNNLCKFLDEVLKPNEFVEFYRFFTDHGIDTFVPPSSSRCVCLKDLFDLSFALHTKGVMTTIYKN